ncbi:ABC transporter substrate-binding protein [Methylobacterium phyllosphaerae]
MPFSKNDAALEARIRIFRDELSKLGWLDGSNVQFDERWSTDDMNVVRSDAASLVGLAPDIILTAGDRVIPIVMRLTSSIPVVVAATSDPIASGAAESLARPGRNVTGFSLVEFSIFRKMLDILKRISPEITRVGMMCNSDNPVAKTYWRWFESSAHQFELQPISLPINDATTIEHAIASISEGAKGGILVPPDITAIIYRNKILERAANHHVPGIYMSPLFLDGGDSRCMELIPQQCIGSLLVMWIAFSEVKKQATCRFSNLRLTG